MKSCCNGAKTCRILRAEGRPAQAVVLMTKLIESRPGDAVAYLNLGTVHAALGEEALASSDFTTAIHLRPDLVEVWYNLGATPEVPASIRELGTTTSADRFAA